MAVRRKVDGSAAPQSCGAHVEDAAGPPNEADCGQMAFVAAGS
jgi:hypothetical protein